ncbi:MAG: hypothetical protein GC161_17150 [Planctomycetaceae bacterium]|nr:hypothetical protein [Planctomycetaceae bacterium]
MSVWKLGRRQGACVRCERAFEEGEAHYSHLFVEGAELGRRDICAACWPGVELGPEQPWWRARRKERRTGGVQVDLGLLEQLFLLSAGAEVERLLELRYLIALLLLRKRRLLLGRVRRGDDGAEWLLLRRPRHQEELAVRVFDFEPDRMEGLRRDLERLLEVGSLDEELDRAEQGEDDTETGAAAQPQSEPVEPQSGPSESGDEAQATAPGGPTQGTGNPA